MCVLTDEINYMVERFEEIDRKIKILKLTKEYLDWNANPIPYNQFSDSKTFSLVIWEGTAREERISQTISKVRDNDGPLPRKLKEKLMSELAQNTELYDKTLYN